MAVKIAVLVNETDTFQDLELNKSRHEQILSDMCTDLVKLDSLTLDYEPAESQG